jgi:serine/threonine-protein kinase
MATILVVDDDPTVLVVIRAALQGAGHQVVLFEDPETALREVRSLAVDAAVLDVVMPGQSGYELLQKLQAEPRTSNLPVLFLSSLDSTPERIRGLRQGADDYLGKPFDPEELVLRVERLVERSSLASTLVPPPDEQPRPPTEELTAEDSPDRLGRYQILELIGEGSMGSVFRGWDPKLQRTVALKTVKLTIGNTTLARADLVSRLLNEAVMGARFSHPNIVAIFDVSDASPQAFIAMEFVEGPSLEHYLAVKARMEPAETAHLGLQMARALTVAHDGGLVHHDIKPGNVILGPHGLVKVTDFGLSNWLSEIVEDSGRVFGTPGFLAPEALRGDGYTEASDLFSLGSLLYRCLTGRPAFPGKTIAGIVATTLGGEVVPPREIIPETPPELEALVLHLLAKRPEDRLSSAAAAARRLEPLAVGSVPLWEENFAGGGAVVEAEAGDSEDGDLSRSRILSLATNWAALEGDSGLDEIV